MRPGFMPKERVRRGFVYAGRIMRPVRTENGASVLILVLWTLFFLGALALAVGGHVSANVRMAAYLNQSVRAHYAAVAGVEKAIAAALQTPTNFIAYRNHAADFEDVAVGDAEFSVSYLVFGGGPDPSVTTNFGIITESVMIDIDWDHWTNRARLDVLVGDALAANILSNYPAHKRIELESTRRYGTYDTLQEMLAVDDIDRETFELLEPLTTLAKFKWRFGEGKRERRASFRGLSEGRVRAGEDGAIIAEKRISFVFCTEPVTNILYWREH